MKHVDINHIIWMPVKRGGTSAENLKGKNKINKTLARLLKNGRYRTRTCGLLRVKQAL